MHNKGLRVSDCRPSVCELPALQQTGYPVISAPGKKWASSFRPHSGQSESCASLIFIITEVGAS